MEDETVKSANSANSANLANGETMQLMVQAPLHSGAMSVHPALAGLADEAREPVENSKSGNTRRAYMSDWANFTGWCSHHGLSSLPASPETVGLYLTDCAKGLKTSTLQRRLATISQAHQAVGQESPTKHGAVRAVWQGIKRSKGMAMQSKTPTLIAGLRVIVEHLPGREEGKKLAVRDRCLLLIGFAGAFRRSVLVGLDVVDLSIQPQGLLIGASLQDGSGRAGKIYRYSPAGKRGHLSRAGVPGIDKGGGHPEWSPLPLQ